MAERTEIRIATIASFAGVSKSTWHEWQTRKGIETKHNHETPKLNWYTPQAVSYTHLTLPTKA